MFTVHAARSRVNLMTAAPSPLLRAWLVTLIALHEKSRLVKPEANANLLRKAKPPAELIER